MKRVLVPVKLDQLSEALLSYAGSFAKAVGAELLLLHCTGQAEVTYTQKSRIIQSLRAFGERALGKQQKPGAGFVHFDCVVRPLSLRENIKKVTQDYAVDLVLMEACPLPAEQCVGSDHAAAVMEQLEVPVMVVPQQSSYQKPRNLVFATDFTDRDPLVLRRIQSFAEQAGARLTLVQVYSPAERAQLCSLKAAMREVEKLLKGKEVKFKLLEEEDMLEGISDFAEQQNTDMLILATQDNHLMQRLFSNAYVKTMAYHTRVPLVTFRQLKQKPCSGCCTNCASKLQHHHKPKAALAGIKTA